MISAHLKSVKHKKFSITLHNSSCSFKKFIQLNRDCHWLIRSHVALTESNCISFVIQFSNCSQLKMQQHVFNIVTWEKAGKTDCQLLSWMNTITKKMEPQAKSNDFWRYPSSPDVSFNFVLSVSGFFGNNNSYKNWEKVASSLPNCMTSCHLWRHSNLNVTIVTNFGQTWQ